MINQYVSHISTRISQWRYFSQPYNSWGKWISYAPAKQYVVLVLLFAFLLSFPVYRYYRNSLSLTENFIELQQKRNQFNHQSRLLTVLRQKDQPHLSKSITVKLASLHQKIQSLAVGLSFIHARWQLQGTPGLDLKIQGHFTEMQQFLTALLQQIPELALLNWHIQKKDETDNDEPDDHYSIESDLSFRLYIDKE